MIWSEELRDVRSCSVFQLPGLPGQPCWSPSPCWGGTIWPGWNKEPHNPLGCRGGDTQHPSGLEEFWRKI